MPRSRGQIAGALPAALAALILLAAPALPGAAGGRVLAHAQLVASSPGAGASVESPPGELRLVFSEPLEEQVTSLDLADEAGTLLLDRTGRVDPADPFALVVDGSELADLADGVYNVTWRTLSAADGHTAEGVFSFGIGSAAATGSPPPVGGMTHTDASQVDVIGRWLTYLGLLLAFGVAVTHHVVVGDRPMPRALVHLLAAGLLVSGVATLVVAVVNAIEAGSGVTDYLVGSRTGILQLARAVVALVGTGVLLVGPRRTARVVAAMAGLIGIGLLVAFGHAAALPGPVAMLSQAVHVAGAAVWIGGLAVLLLAVSRPALLFDTQAPPPMRALVPRFSALALVSIGLVGLTGVYSAWSQTGVLVDPGTEYGRRLITKSVVAAAAIGLGGLNFLDGGRMRSWLNGMRTRLSIEAGLAAVVLLVTASLATTPPVDKVGGVAIAPVPDAFGATTPGMTLTVSPGRPGVNRVVATTTDAMAMISGGLELVLDRVDAGTTTRVPLTLAPGAMAGHEGMDDRGAEPRGSDSPVDWIADAVVLPTGSDWDASVLAVAVGGSELARQRFSFAVSDDGVAEGAIRSIADPVSAIALVLLIGGAIGIGLGLGGGRLPRTDPAASRLALRVGGLTAVALGAAIGLDRLLSL
jgi:copper transport protein